MDTKETLQSIDLLSGLTDEQIKMLVPVTVLVENNKAEALFNVGQEANDLYILLEGKISIQVKLSSRPETVGIVVLQNRGQLVGWSGLIGGSHYTAKALCQEDSKLLQIDGEGLMKALESNPSAGFEVMRKIARVISNRMHNLQSVVLKTL